MKIRTDRKSNKKCKPFSVLSKLLFVRLEDEENTVSTMPVKSQGLKLFTKTWPVKRRDKNGYEEEERPLTATLEKPTVLDVRFMRKIDMSLVRKEFLNISMLCRMPLVLKKNHLNLVNTRNRTLCLKVSGIEKKKKKKKVVDEALEDQESSVVETTRNSRNSLIKKIKPRKISNVDIAKDPNNNKPLALHRTNHNSIVDELSGSAGGRKSSSIKLPQPCKTCGRPNQPERFHSHPESPAKVPHRKMENSPKPPVKSSVQKPVAIKYKPKGDSEKKSALRSAPVDIKKSPPNVAPVSHEVRPKSVKRTLTCYICGREFGSASLPLHEPKCLEKWERENANLPSNLRRKTPVKPDKSLTKEEWNQMAWESSQSNLVPCQNCGRTFYPDRLIVHQKSCKTPQLKSQPIKEPPAPTVVTSQTSPSSPSISQPLSVACYVCGRLFGTHSIKIHERQCLKKWHAENESLPSDMRRPQPTRKENKSDSDVTSKEKQLTVESGEEKTTKKSPLFPCYLCGKLFTVNSIYIHEPQCLKLWKIENDKLTPNKRRPIPMKPDIKFTGSGKVDYQATAEANWKSHLEQLIPCKRCSRTFNPDRVEIHERSCKGM